MMMLLYVSGYTRNVGNLEPSGFAHMTPTSISTLVHCSCGGSLIGKLVEGVEEWAPLNRFFFQTALKLLLHNLSRMLLVLLETEYNKV